MFPMGKPTSTPLSRPMFPGAGGYGGSVTVGQGVLARQAAAAQTARNTAQAAEMAKPMFPGSGGYGGSIAKGQAGVRRRPQPVMGTGSAGRTAPGRANKGLGQYSGPTRTHRINANMGAARKRGINRPVVSAPTNGAAVNATADVVKESKKGMALFKNPKKAALIGAGLAVAGTVAMNRRGEGASSGRQSMYRY